MTVIHYESLTWPEVAELPRALPLVLPLGGGYNDDAIAAAVGTADYVILPALPYGWRGSLINVESTLLRRVVAGILSAPQEEGFTNLVIISTSDVQINIPGVRYVQLEADQSAEPVTITTSPERVVLIPAGHTEQHGYHLPMNTDTIIINAIAEGTVQAIPDKTEMLPALPYGVSTHRAEFAGTFNMGGRVYEDFMLAIIQRLVERGADRFYLMSGHGGNCSFLVNVVKYAGERHRGIFAATTWLHTSGRIATPVVQQHRRSARGGMGHAGELETAYLLHLRPDLCKMARVVDEIDFISTPDYFMDWVEGGSLVANPPWGDDTQTGSYGAGSVATATNGQRWLAAAIEEKVAHVMEIHEQQDRRIAKRKAKS